MEYLWKNGSKKIGVTKIKDNLQFYEVIFVKLVIERNSLLQFLYLNFNSTIIKMM